MTHVCMFKIDYYFGDFWCSYAHSASLPSLSSGYCISFRWNALNDLDYSKSSLFSVRDDSVLHSDAATGDMACV